MNDHENTAERAAWHEALDSRADINDKLIISLRDISRTMQLLYEGKGSQKRILMILEELGGRATQRALTERLGIQPGSASEVLAKLESAGSIQRAPHETDRRIMDVALTEAGKALAAEAKAQRLRRHEQMFACLTGEEKRQLLSLLEKVNAHWKEQYQSGPRKLPQASDRHGHGRRPEGA